MKPLLACSAPENLNSLPYPLFASEKLDGIRCVIKDGIALSRTLKPIRNRYIQSILGRPELNGLDGELIVGDPAASDCMRKTNSGVMSFDGEPDFAYYVFDIWDRRGAKYKDVKGILPSICVKHPKTVALLHRLCHNATDVESYEREALDEGFEGLILRRPDGTYKYGRSTAKEGFLYKLKRYHQDEAAIIGYEALEHNDNIPEINELGYTHRSSSADGKIKLPLLGALVVEGKFQDFSKVTFNIGTGFTMAERETFWQQRDTLIGQIVTYKVFPTGSKDRPRHPVFVSFRDASDL